MGSQLQLLSTEKSKEVELMRGLTQTIIMPCPDIVCLAYADTITDDDKTRKSYVE